jgi:hypothetical protein
VAEERKLIYKTQDYQAQITKPKTSTIEALGFHVLRTSVVEVSCGGGASADTLNLAASVLPGLVSSK